MDDFSPLHDIYVSAKFKAYLSEGEGSDLVGSLEKQFNCRIGVNGSSLMITNRKTDVGVDHIESRLRQGWQTRDFQRTFREATLAASCTYQCRLHLPRAYAAVIAVYVNDIKRRSEVTDILIDHFDGNIIIFGSEGPVAKARQFIEVYLVEHFGPLDTDLEHPRPTERHLSSIHSTPVRREQYGSPINSRDTLDSSFTFETNLVNSFESKMTLSSPQKYISNNSERMENVRMFIPAAQIGRLLGPRGQTKRRVEVENECFIVVKRESDVFGTVPIDIYSKTVEMCQQARAAVERHLMVTPVGSPIRETRSYECTPQPPSLEKKWKRSSFRNQPKVLLELSPRKTPIS